MYLPKIAQVKINYVVHDKDTKHDEFKAFGEIQKIDLSKFVDQYEEPVSFMFKPNQAQLQEEPNLPILVKLDAELTVRPSDSALTTSNEHDTQAVEQFEKKEIEKAFTLSVEQFKGEDPIFKICKDYDELKDLTDLNAIKKKLFDDKELRKKICEQHQIIRYVLDGLGFEFPLDE